MDGTSFVVVVVVVAVTERLRGRRDVGVVGVASFGRFDVGDDDEGDDFKAVILQCRFDGSCCYFWILLWGLLCSRVLSLCFIDIVPCTYYIYCLASSFVPMFGDELHPFRPHLYF